jgi:RNA-directed DNA polymerase
MSKQRHSRGAHQGKQNTTCGSNTDAASTVGAANKPRRRCVLEMSPEEARDFFMKPESYSSLSFPPYIDFARILGEVMDALQAHDLPEKIFCEGVNHIILNNKDGRYAWRPMELIHPILYTNLVRKITHKDNWDFIRKRFKEFGKNKSIRCLSLPAETLTNQSDIAEQIRYWWQEVEQESMKLSLDYEFSFHTDISNCYGSIYTHSIAWALHGKETAKSKRGDTLLIGNIIDNSIQNMRYRQTNGIPQGSVLMDFIAEMILGYADCQLSERLMEERDYCILRYRDDYRIFSNNSEQARRILKELTEVLFGLGLKINSEKTEEYSDLITSSIKPDKLAWITKKQHGGDLREDLLIIHQHGREYPNGGVLCRALNDYYERLTKENVEKDLLSNPMPLIAIVVDIAYRHPKTYPVCAAILSKLLSFMHKEESTAVITKIRDKFRKIPSTGYMEVWLQRISLPFNKDIQYQEPICSIVSGENCELWNNNWLNDKKHASLKSIIDCKKITKREEINKLDMVIPKKEFELFITRY